MEAKLMHIFTGLWDSKNSGDREDPEPGREAAAAQRLAIESVLAGRNEVSASQQEDPLGWLIGIVEQGKISQEEALLAVTPELLGEITLNKGNTDSRKAIDTLLKWSDEYRHTPIRIYGDAPENVNRLSTMPASIPDIESFDGYSLLHGPLSQTSSRVGELCYAYLDAAESGQMNPVPNGKPNPIPIPGSCASDTYKTFNKASGLPGLCEHLSRRIIGLLETEYEGLFESLNGSPLSIALIEQNNAVGIGSLQDMQLEALLRAALRSVRQGGEPRLEILVRNPADVSQFRATRDWIDGVAEQTLCGRLRCIPYRVGVLLTVDVSMKPDESQPRNGHSGEHASANHMPEVNAQQIKQASQAADMARFADMMILEVTPIVSANSEAEERLNSACANDRRNSAAALNGITEAIRCVKPELPIWLALAEIYPFLDGAAIWENELTGIICPNEAVPAARIGTARCGILQCSEQQHSSDALHKHAQQFPL
ncbi:PEP-utilizing protein [Paenibacillus kribbensis]|uniref:PEP-utilizing protein n=1 Tax=Paenibacillus kribbensis TaxID=172713 RepID=UPI0015B90537|nr:PEP-utilizing protein [Paenibacillus kribbensis]